MSYLNTKPLIYGFEKGLMKDDVELIIDYPSGIAQMLLENKIDLGLVPVAILPELKQYEIISDYCISCDGEVASVCLFSDVPLESIERIMLDYQSRTSVELIKILAKKFWKIDPVFEDTSNGYQDRISGKTAALVIGDRALYQRKKSPYIYDLGLEWKKFTGLPFVFAAWIANKKFDATFVKSFNEVNGFGPANLTEVAEKNQLEVFNIYKYYTSYISYHLDEEKRKGLDLFLGMLGTEKTAFKSISH